MEVSICVLACLTGLYHVLAPIRTLLLLRLLKASNPRSFESWELAGGQMHQIQGQNQKLVLHCSEVEEDKRRILQQLEDIRDKWATAAQENMRLQGELAAMRKALEVLPVAFHLLSFLQSV